MGREAPCPKRHVDPVPAVVSDKDGSSDAVTARRSETELHVATVTPYDVDLLNALPALQTSVLHVYAVID